MAWRLSLRRRQNRPRLLPKLLSCRGPRSTSTARIWRTRWKWCGKWIRWASPAALCRSVCWLRSAIISRSKKISMAMKDPTAKCWPTARLSLLLICARCNARSTATSLAPSAARWKRCWPLSSTSSGSIPNRVCVTTSSRLVSSSPMSLSSSRAKNIWC